LAVATVGGLASSLAGGSFEQGFFAAGVAFAVNQTLSGGGHRGRIERKRQKHLREVAARKDGRVYLTGHRVAGSGPTHVAIEATVNGQTTVISGGPAKGVGDNLYGNSLAGGYNDTSDLPINNSTLAVISPPQGVSNAEYILTLDSAQANYCDCLPYELFPGITGSHNSNSFIHGLIDATGGSINYNLDGLVGGSDPVPACAFSKQGC